MSSGSVGGEGEDREIVREDETTVAMTHAVDVGNGAGVVAALYGNMFANHGSGDTGSISGGTSKSSISISTISTDGNVAIAFDADGK